MSRIVAAALAVAALAAAARAEPPKLKFQEYASKDGKFTARMPGTPTTSEDGNAKTVGVRTDGGPGFAVTYFDLDAVVLVTSSPAEVLDGLVKEMKTSAAAFDGPKDVTVAGGTAVEYTAEPGKGKYLRGRFVLVGTRAYHVFVVCERDKGFLSSKDADTFFDSFKPTK